METQKYKFLFQCSTCDYTTSQKLDFDAHNLSRTCTMELLETQKYKKKPSQLFICESCDYTTSVKCNFTKHMGTARHNIYTFVPTSIKSINYKCNKCGHKYASKSGLWKHSKQCMYDDNAQILLNVIKKDEQFKDFLMEQNKQLVEQLTDQNNKLMEQNKQLVEQTQTHTTINSNYTSNKFSINVFLNEQCKDALNITDFIKSLVLSIKDLEDTSRLGYVEGISRIFIDGLNQLDICKRPVHCSDLKRDVIYIKDEDQWTKDNDTKDKITNAIKYIANKNIKQITEWQKKNTDYLDPNSKQNDKYMKMLCEVMSGGTKDEQTKNYQKIIKNVSKEVVIGKDKV